MSPDEKRRVLLEHAPEDVRPHLNIFLDQAQSIERHVPEDRMLGLYEDALDLVWRHAGRPHDRPGVGARAIEDPPKSELEKRSRPFDVPRSGMI